MSHFVVPCVSPAHLDGRLVWRQARRGGKLRGMRDERGRGVDHGIGWVRKGRCEGVGRECARGAWCVAKNGVEECVQVVARPSGLVLAWQVESFFHKWRLGRRRRSQSGCDGQRLRFQLHHACPQSAYLTARQPYPWHHQDTYTYAKRAASPDRLSISHSALAATHGPHLGNPRSHCCQTTFYAGQKRAHLPFTCMTPLARLQSQRLPIFRPAHCVESRKYKNEQIRIPQRGESDASAGAVLRARATGGDADVALPPLLKYWNGMANSSCMYALEMASTTLTRP